MRWGLTMVGWLVMVVAVYLLAPGQVTLDRDGPGDREVWSVLGPGDEVTVRLGAREPRLRVLSHLETPAPEELDEHHNWLYGLETSLEPLNEPPVSGELWTRSRVTILPEGTEALLPARPGAVLADSRIMEIEPAQMLPHGGTIKLRPLFQREGQRILLRVYRERPAQTLERLQRLVVPHGRAERLDRALPFGWEALSSPERRWLTGTVRERLPTEGPELSSAVIHRLAPPSPAPRLSGEGFVLEPGQGTVLNLKGPVSLNVATEREDPHGGLVKGVYLETTLVDASPRPFPSVEVDPYRVDVPDGALWSIRWVNPWDRSAVSMRFALSPKVGHTWGSPPGAAGEQPPGPEIRRITSWHLDKGLTPVRVPVATGSAWGSLAVELRPRPPEGWVGGEEEAEERGASPVTVSYEALDGAGRLLGRGTFEAAFLHSPFERYVDDEPQWAGEDSLLHLFHPSRATEVRFTSDGPVDLRFLAPVDTDPQRGGQYELPEGWRPRYAPWDTARFVALKPLDADLLVEEERMVRLDATVRIEPVPGASHGPHLRTSGLEPEGRWPGHLVMERFASARSPWESWHRTRLTGRHRLELPEEGDLLVDYRVPPAAVGEQVRLSCDGAPAHGDLSAAAGLLRLRGLPAGSADCVLSGPDGEFLARARGTGERWTRRHVFRLDRGEITFPVQVAHDQRTTVFIRTYTPRGVPAPPVETLVDGGQPDRHGGPARMLTRGRKLAVPDSSGLPGRLEDREDGALTVWDGVRVILGDDLRAGWHLVTVRLPDASGGPVYVRADATRAPASELMPEHWAREVRCDLKR